MRNPLTQQKKLRVGRGTAIIKKKKYFCALHRLSKKKMSMRVGTREYNPGIPGLAGFRHPEILSFLKKMIQGILFLLYREITNPKRWMFLTVSKPEFVKNKTIS